MRRVVLLATLALSGFASADQCTVDGLTNKCEFFKSLKPGDVLEFEGGFTFPACALSSVDSAANNKRDEERKIAMGKLAEIFSRAPKGSIDDSQLTQFLQGYGSIDDLFRTRPFETSWPPGAHWKKQTRRTVTPAEFHEYFEGLLGKDGLRDLKAVRAGERENQDRDMERRIHPSQYLINEGVESRETRLFQRSKDMLEKYLLRGRKPAELSAEERNMLARMKSVRQRKGTATTADCGPAYTAFFDYGDNDAGFPPGMMFQPDESLMRSMIHELSHSIDHCRMSDRQAAGGNQPAILPEKNPFHQVQRCLVTDHDAAFGARSFDGKPAQPLSAREACEHNRHHEAYCDWMAAEVLAQGMREGKLAPGSSPPLQPLKPVKEGRRVKVPKGWEPIFYQLDNACGEGNFESMSHPKWRDRLDLIMLKQPEIRKSLGCGPAAEPGCRIPGSQILAPPSGRPQDSKQVR